MAQPSRYCLLVLGVVTSSRLLKSFGQANTLFVTVPGLQAELGVTVSLLSFLFSCACLVAAAVQPLFGRLHDAWGGRVTITLALLLLALSLLSLSLSTSLVGVFASLVGLRAVGLGALDTFTANTVSSWFVAQRGAALAAMTVGHFLGSNLILVQGLTAVNAAAGWRNALRCAAAACIFYAPVCVIFVRRSPESMGLRPDYAQPSSEADEPELEGATRAEALQSPSFWAMAAFTLCGFAAASGTDFHLIAIVAEAGTVSVAHTLSIATGVSAGVACLLVGRAIDRNAPPAHIVTAGGLLLAAYVLLLTSMSTPFAAAIGGLAKGASDACSGVALPYLHARRFGRRNLGAIFAVNRTAGVLGSGVGPLLLGLARDILGSYKGALMVGACAPALTALLCLYVER